VTGFRPKKQTPRIRQRFRSLSGASHENTGIKACSGLSPDYLFSKERISNEEARPGTKSILNFQLNGSEEHARLRQILSY
jgi:hypothetical protein